MESGPLGMDTNIAPDPRVQSNCSLAFLRRRAWAQSKDSTWQESEAGSCGPQEPQQNQTDGVEQRPSEEPGRVPNNITSWLIECRTPLAASLDDQSASPSRGVLRNGCSFEDDLSLGAEANHLQSRNSKTESCFGLAADQKRSQYKEKARSMNSTGSGKSSTVSSVSELLDLYEEDPEEILLNLGFGREEPNMASKVPSRFFSNTSTARGIDIKVYLGAQLQRMEVENPNYALTSRFRQIEVLTTVANEFFQLYSQVSGQPVQCISSKDQGREGGGDESTPPLRRSGSARNVAKLLKTTLSKHNLLAAACESVEAHTPNQQTQLNGHAPSGQSHTNGHAHAGPEQDGCSTDPAHQPETVNQNHMRKKDSCSLATVAEETSGDGDDSPEQSRTGPASNGGNHPESADSQLSNERTEEGTQMVKEEQVEEKILTPIPEKAPPTLAPLKLAQLRTENTDSFDMEEIQSNEDEALPPRTLRGTDLLRTVSQQSDSSGFAEEPSADSNNYLKVQESSDSCDSETTVTSHPSIDVATPLAMDQPAFELPDGQEEEAEPDVAAEADGRILSALIRAKQKQVTRGEQRVNPQSADLPQTPGGERGRRGIPLQRSSSLPSLPSSFPSPCRVVSSVRIQFGRGQASCTQPRYSFKYNDVGEEEEEEEEEGQTNCLSTLIINPAPSPDSNNQPPRLPTEPSIPPKPIPRYLLRSTCSLQNSSPPYDLSPGDAHTWSTQSVPDLSSNQQQPGQFHQNMTANQNQQNWNPGQTMFRFPNPNPTAQYVYPSPNPSPSLNPSPYPFSLNPPPQYPSPLHPYASFPNLHQNLTHHSSLTSLYQSTTPTVSQHGSLSNLHQPSTSTAPHPFNLGNLHPGSPAMHHQAYNQLYGHQSPYHASPHGSQFASPYLGNHVYNMNPHLAFPHPVTQCPPLAPEHGLHPGFAPPAPGFFPGLASSLGPGHSFHPGLAPHTAPGSGPSQGPSSTEMQLRRVLHDIRGTVQNLSQKRADTPDMFSEHRAALPNHQSLAEFQQKRQSLNLFRTQMTDLEQSIIRQQALVYKHLSPADRMEVEQLQSLRSAVREELQELEQQLEDRLMELTHHTQHRGHHRDSSFDSMSTTSALRAMEPVSDLLREQLLLQSELSYDGHSPSTTPSSRTSSPAPGGDGEQKGGLYRASININPVPPPRPNTRTEEEGESDGGGVPEEQGALGGIGVGNLQQLIREIRESVAQEVRQEIYSELLSAVSPRQLPLPGRQHPL
ncbi:hypothetical protein VZT92_005565 [Zoarces viviparus]|uniref:ITPR-interacting domain-containing protein n=1 Tax=Zoarces viviparus TaxID=48416 RepID=A0AAW1FV71_ZOAVI